MSARWTRAWCRTRAGMVTLAVTWGMAPAAAVSGTGVALRVTGAAAAAGSVAGLAIGAPMAQAATASGGPAAGGTASGGQLTAPSGSSLEDAASRAGDTGRKVAFSLIGLALAVAAIVLAFKRDFKEAVGVLAIGLVAILLASPTGVDVLQQTVAMLFGGA